MKKIIFLIAIVFVSIGMFSQTQQEKFADNDWYVYKLVINGQEYIAPINEERLSLNDPNISYNPENNSVWLFFCGNYGFEDVLFINDNQWVANYWVGLPLNYCSQQENLDFSVLFTEVILYSYDTEYYLFDFEINDLEELIITNENGDKAYFNNASAFQIIFNSADVKIYPNPASSYLNIRLPESEHKNVVVNIYDVSGRKVNTFTTRWQENIRLDMSSLASGNYFLELNTEHHKGKGYIRKIIKE